MANEKTAGLIQNLERSCEAGGDREAARAGWVRAEQPSSGIERMEVFFHGQGYTPHRHDVYAIGRTAEGVQCFNYRGAARVSLAGQTIVLHPDEVHDGAAGTEAGLRYRMLYVEPALISEALGGVALPFVEGGVSGDEQLCAATAAALADLGETPDDLGRGDLLLPLAETLAAVAGQAPQWRPSVDMQAIARTRAFLTANTHLHVDSADLEAVSGLDRWSLARQFRVVCGTSPYRYFVMRRLEKARTLISTGMGLADTALASGFADQSHMTRHFARAFGMTPGRWARLSLAG